MLFIVLKIAPSEAFTEIIPSYRITSSVRGIVILAPLSFSRRSTLLISYGKNELTYAVPWVKYFSSLRVKTLCDWPSRRGQTNHRRLDVPVDR